MEYYLLDEALIRETTHVFLIFINGFENSCIVVCDPKMCMLRRKHLCHRLADELHKWLDGITSFDFCEEPN